MGIHLLHCFHANKGTKTHDVIPDTFATITRYVNFHVKQKQLHAFPSTTFNSFCRRIDIVLTKNGTHTLANIVIANLTQANLLP
jgi:hypothetical protein